MRTQAAEAYGQYYCAGLAALLLALGALYVYAAVRLGGHLSRQLSRPIEELRRVAVPPTVESTLQIHPMTPRILGHYDPLRRAFSNLIRNAVEAMVGAGRLEIRIASGAGGVIVAFADRGPGIPLEQRAQVFEPYWTTKDEGTRLGAGAADSGGAWWERGGQGHAGGRGDFGHNLGARCGRIED